MNTLQSPLLFLSERTQRLEIRNAQPSVHLPSLTIKASCLKLDETPSQSENVRRETDRVTDQTITRAPFQREKIFQWNVRSSTPAWLACFPLEASFAQQKINEEDKNH